MSKRASRSSGVKVSATETKRRQRAKKKARAKAEAEAARTTKRQEVTAVLGVLPRAIADVAEADLASGSADAVITDPPYAEADVPLYGELARFAMRTLKPGGWCLAMTGDLYLDRVLALMTTEGLLARGFVAVAFSGGEHSRIGGTWTFQACKLVLMLQKPPGHRPPIWGPNLLIAPKNGHDKSLHEWQQSQPVFERLVERFTLPGQLVADPFAGAGTTLRAALALGRRAWGADIDAPGNGEDHV